MGLSQVCQVGNPPSPTLLPQEDDQFLGDLFPFLGLGVVPWLYQDATGQGLFSVSVLSCSRTLGTLVSEFAYRVKPPGCFAKAHRLTGPSKSGGVFPTSAFPSAKWVVRLGMSSWFSLGCGKLCILLIRR